MLDMENTRGIANKYGCEWLDTLLKDALEKKDLRTYNRIKCVVYHYPEMLKIPQIEFKCALKYASETYICIREGDKRYPMLDEIYRNKHRGQDFEPLGEFETRYITIDDMCKCFGI